MDNDKTGTPTLELERRGRLRISDPSYLVQRLGEPVDSIDAWKVRVQDGWQLQKRAETPAAIAKVLTPTEQTERRLRGIFSATGRELHVLLILWHALRNIYAQRATSWIQYEQLVVRQLMTLAHLAKRTSANPDVSIAPVTKELGGFRFSAALCAQLTMGFEKVIAALCSLSGEYDEYDVVADEGERNGVVREWRAVVPQLPVLPVELPSPISRINVGLAMLESLDRASHYRTRYLDAELAKSRSKQCNYYFIVSKLVEANVGMVVFYGFRNDHLSRSFDLSYFWMMQSFIRSFGIGVVLQGSAALQTCSGPAFSAAFPESITQLPPYLIDEPSARKTAEFYWSRLGLRGRMPATVVHIVQYLAGQRLWIEKALARMVEQILFGKQDAESAAQVALKDTLLDAMSGPLPAIHEQSNGTLTEQRWKEWRDWLLVPEVSL